LRAQIRPEHIKVLVIASPVVLLSEVVTARTAFRYQEAPFARDRTIGCRFVRSFGEVFQASDGTWVLTSAEAVHFAHRHPEIFSSKDAFGAAGIPVPLIPVAIDPPDHVRYRRILDPMLAPRVVNAVEGELRAQIRDIILTFAGKGHCDAIADLAKLYPTQVFLTLFGLPLADRDQLMEWVERMNENSATGTGEPNPMVREAAMEFFHYCQRYIKQKRETPGNDMLSSVLALEGEEAWTDDQVLGLCVLFSVAGLDTVTGAIGFLLLRLARDPQLRKRMIADPALTGPVIEEVLRLEPPSPHQPRITTQDVEVCGVTIPAGSPVILFAATANRDPAKFADPDDLDIVHDRPGHTAFGGGIHRCLGSHLARRELRLVVEEFHNLIPDYEVAPGSEPRIVWPSATWHLASLPLVFPPG
jgi:cytochrome P450